LLQALWREDRDLPIGSYVNEDGKRHKLGSRISESAGRGGSNFLTLEIAHTARREAAYSEVGALIDAERLAVGFVSGFFIRDGACALGPVYNQGIIPARKGTTGGADYDKEINRRLLLAIHAQARCQPN
jgi:hypothetical protein